MKANGAPKGALKISPRQRFDSSESYQRDGTGGFRLGQRVRVNDDVRSYAGRVGTVAAASRVVPKAIADKLHREGKTTNNGDFEIGLDFTTETVIDNLRASASFLPRELAPEEAVERRHKVSGRPASPVLSGVGVPVGDFDAHNSQSEPSR